MADNTQTDAQAKAAAEAKANTEKQSKADAKAKVQAELNKPGRYIVGDNIVDPDGNIIMPLLEK
jgi:gamma-glutamylcysteine synthetase